MNYPLKKKSFKSKKSNCIYIEPLGHNEFNPG